MLLSSSSNKAKAPANPASPGGGSARPQPIQTPRGRDEEERPERDDQVDEGACQCSTKTEHMALTQEGLGRMQVQWCFSVLSDVIALRACRTGRARPHHQPKRQEWARSPSQPCPIPSSPAQRSSREPRRAPWNSRRSRGEPKMTRSRRSAAAGCVRAPGASWSAGSLPAQRCSLRT